MNNSKLISMKTVIFSVLFLAFLLNSSVVISQNDIMFFKRAKVQIIGEYDGNEVKLRIAPADIENWEYGLQHGYKIERKTLIDNGTELSREEIMASGIVLVDHMKPVSESDWDNTVEDNDNSRVAKAMLYGDDFKVNDVNTVEFDEAFNVNSEQENRYSFSLYTAEQSFDLAVNMGLGYVDNTVAPNSKYIYLVVPSDLESYGNSVFKGYVEVSTMSTQSAPVPSNLTIMPGDSVMYLSWEQGDNRKFSSFDIERSEDGVNFEKVNDLPVVPANESGNNDIVYYLDSVPENGVEYFYRVTGRTSFGPTNAYTDVKSGIGKEAPFEMATTVDSIREEEEGKLKIYWKTPVLTGETENHVKGYNVYRATKSDGTFELLNSEPLSPTQTTYIDQNPNPSNYYIIESIDDNDNKSKTIAYLGQPVDKEPPAPPIVISAECNKSGVITINWEPNTEPDLGGYRVYYAYNPKEEFSIIGTTKSTEYIYDISLKTLSHKIYFKLVAEDLRENYSDFSELIEVGIPDIVPPERPTIVEARPFQNKIKIKCLLSKSEDLAYHKILRKKYYDEAWDTLYVLAANMNKDFVYYDSSAINRQKYIYKLIAADKNNNISESRSVEVSILDSGERGKITGFGLLRRKLSIDEMNHVVTYNSLAEMIINNNEIPDSISKSKFKNVVLGWDYNYPQDLLGFSVFRSTNNLPFSRYKFYTIKELFGVDNWQDIPVQDGKIHCLAFDLEARTNSVVKYKVRAIHDYGGYSQFSKIKYINIWGFDRGNRKVDNGGEGGLGH